ncbi:hypothetical protein SD71_16745 [Cohnella kolymensis]|uniref:Uncharacterized protein n=1 Tax=Cohnella kolymensis TaxID=1590652 RepID=A0ABR5A158_9BACL|nr:hypothetical protein [Cohnella kolymensis]KIL34716.1 hypothetical protein SD71_16745 [Cohnella kolymensis]
MLLNHYALEKVASYRSAELEKHVRIRAEWDDAQRKPKKRSADDARPSSSLCPSGQLCSQQNV